MFVSKKYLIVLAKKMLGSQRKVSRKANEFAVIFYKEHKHENIKYMQNYWSKNFDGTISTIVCLM
ncbi:MAG: hypothetical protein FJ041_00550 [Candidatus Cloacimonetes bacterium]|nr:hypothetical protein [Candidatus Cloacimonadota bacterium]